MRRQHQVAFLQRELFGAQAGDELRQMSHGGHFLLRTGAVGALGPLDSTLLRHLYFALVERGEVGPRADGPWLDLERRLIGFFGALQIPQALVYRGDVEVAGAAVA